MNISIHKCFVCLLVLVVAGCGGGGGSTPDGDVADVFATPPDETGTALVIGTSGAATGGGVVEASLVSTTSTSTSAAKQSAGACQQESVPVEDDGSFTLPVCAQVHHRVRITHRYGSSNTNPNGMTRHLGTLTIPSESEQSCPKSGQRLFSLKNKSNRKIWLGVTAGTMSCLSDADCPTGAAGSCQGAVTTGDNQKAGTCACSTGEDCGTIAECSTSNNFCYWNLPKMGTSQIKLAEGARTAICFPKPAEGLNIQWSGNMFARTGCKNTPPAGATSCSSTDENCKFASCETGECKTDTKGRCDTGVGGNPPVTLFEFTLSNQSASSPTQSPDFYDVSIINGINVAMSVQPVEGTFDTASNDDPYYCESPGLETASGALEACTWEVVPTVDGVDQTITLRDVIPTAIATTATCPNGAAPNSLGYCACTQDSDCSSGELCGLAQNAAPSAMFANVCGKQVGWWTADQICGADTSFGEPLNCGTKVANTTETIESTYADFFKCVEAAGATQPLQSQSCYNSAAVVDCCGCPTSSESPLSSDWPTALSPSFGGSDGGCYSNNPNWNSIAQPWLVHLKKACPTAYTYPFDDATSTFTCRKGADTKETSYKVLFLDTK